jgi:hypothetical protein
MDGRRISLFLQRGFLVCDSRPRQPRRDGDHGRDGGDDAERLEGPLQAEVADGGPSWLASSSPSGSRSCSLHATGSVTTSSPGLPELPLSGLGDSDARALLLDNVHGPLDSAVFPKPRACPCQGPLRRHEHRTIKHEFVVIRTDKPAGDLLKGNDADESGVGELDGVKAGNARVLVLDLKRGHYALIRSLPGHYKTGQFADFYVR